MAVDGKGNSTGESEVYVTEVFGFPIIRRYVETGNAKKMRVHDSKMLCTILQAVKICVGTSMLISLAIAVGILYCPPPLIQEIADYTLHHLQGFSGKFERMADADELRKNLSMCEMEKLVLKESLGKCMNEMSQLSARFEEEKEKFERQLNEKKSELKTLEENNENLKKSVQVYETTELEVQKNLTLLNQTKVATEKRLVAAEEEMNSMEKRAELLKKRLDDGKRREDELQSMAMVVKKKKNEMERLLIRAEQEGVRMEKQVKQSEVATEICKQAKTQLASSLADSKEKLRQTKKTFANLENNFKNTQNKLSKIAEEKTEMLQELKDTKTKVDVCVNKTQELDETKKENLKQLAELQENVDVLKDDLKNITNKKLALSKELDKTLFKLGECRNKDMEHQVSNAELLTELDEVKKELEKCLN